MDEQDIYTLALGAIIIAAVAIRWSKPDQRITKPLWDHNGRPTDAATLRALVLLSVCALVSDAGGPIAGPILKVLTPTLYESLDTAPWAGFISAFGLGLYVVTVWTYVLMIWLATTEDYNDVRRRLWPRGQVFAAACILVMFVAVAIGQPAQFDLLQDWQNGAAGDVGQLAFWIAFGAAYFVAGIVTIGRILRRRQVLPRSRSRRALSFFAVTSLMMIMQPGIRYIEIADLRGTLTAPWAADAMDINIAILCICGFAGGVMIAMARSRDSKALKRLWLQLLPVDPGKHLPSDHKTGSHVDWDRSAEIQEWLRILVWRMPPDAWQRAWDALPDLEDSERLAVALRAWITVALTRPAATVPHAALTGLPDLGTPAEALHTLIRVAKTPNETAQPATNALEDTMFGFTGFPPDAEEHLKQMAKAKTANADTVDLREESNTTTPPCPTCGQTVPDDHVIASR